MNELTKEDLIRFRDNNHLTVGDLKRMIEKHNLPDNAIVLVERVEDKYFEGGCDISGMSSANGILPEGSRSSEWGVYLVDGENHYYAKKYNEDVANGEWEDKPPHPIYTEEQLRLCKDQFVPAWCCGPYKKEKDIFLIHMHY